MGEGGKAIAIIGMKRQSPCVKKNDHYERVSDFKCLCEQLVQAKKQVMQEKTQAAHEINRKNWGRASSKCNINESSNKLRASELKTAQECSQKVVGKK